MAADDDNDPPKNPFVRWKKHVDAHIGLTLNSLLGIPAIVTKNLNIHPIDDDSTDSSSPDSSNVRNPDSSPPSSSSPTFSPSSPSLSSSSSSSSSSSYPQSSAAQDSLSPASTSTDSDGDGGILDGVDAAQLLEWHKFIYYSPYSPLKLQQQQQYHMLPPPIPRDAPFGADPYSFTYTDAFEDLLRASSGRSLLDLATRSYRNLHYQMRYGSSVEPPYVFFHRMHGEKLLDAYFPKTAVPAGSNSTSHNTLPADTPNDNVVQAVAALAERENREPWREQLEGSYDDGYDDDDDDDDDREAYEEWNRQAGAGRDDGNSWFPGRRSHQGGLFDELDRVFRVLSRIIDEDTGVASKKRGIDSGRDDSHDAVRDAGRDADAEDELYTAVRSAYSNAEKSLSTFVKSFSNISSGAAAAGSATATANDATRAQQTQQQVVDEQQGETIQTTEDHTDMFGNRHVKTVVRRLDADGNEISRETHYTIRSAKPSEKNNSREEASGSHREEESSSETQQADRQTDSKTPDGTQPSGWFWK